MNVKSQHNINSDRSQANYDAIINAYTLLVIELVPEAKPFNPTTLCIVDGEFVCISEFDIDDKLASIIENVAKSL